MKNFIILMSFLLSFASFANVDFDFSALGGGRIKVVIQGVKGGNFQVNFYKKHKNDSGDGRYVDNATTNSGGLSHVVSSNFSDDEQVTVSILNYSGSGNHLKRLSRTYGNLNGGGSNPNPTYSPPAPTATPSMPLSKIRDYADQQARTVANRIANTYGKRENFRHNFVKGLWKGYNAYNRYQQGSDYGYSEYNRGFEVGRNDGNNSGYTEGARDAARNGSSAGAADARSRFVKALDGAATLDTTLGNISVPYYNGASLTGGYQTPSMDSKLRELENDFNFRVCRAYSWDYDGYNIACEWSLADAYRSNGSYSYIDSWFRADYAYTEWKNNGLGGRYDYNIYNDMNHNEKQTYMQYFKSTYNQVIDEKFEKVKNKENSTFQNLGFEFGILLGKEMAFQNGLVDGYKSGFTVASIKGFNKNYQLEYTKGFDRRVELHRTQPVLENFNAYLSGLFLPETNVDLVITNLVNLGTVDATNEIAKISGNSIVSLVNIEMISVPALTTLKNKVVVKNIGRIKANTPPQKLQEVNVHFATLNKSLSYEVSWKKIIDNFVKLPLSGTDYQKSLKYVAKELGTELINARKTEKNIYKDNSSSLLAQIVALNNSTSAQGKMNIKNIASMQITGNQTLCDIATDVNFLLDLSRKKIRDSFIAQYKSIDPNCRK